MSKLKDRELSLEHNDENITDRKQIVDVLILMLIVLIHVEIIVMSVLMKNIVNEVYILSIHMKKK